MLNRKWWLIPIGGIIFLLSLIVIVLWFPGLWLNSSTLNWSKDKYLTEWVDWDSAELDIENTSFWVRDVKLSVNGLKIQSEDINGQVEAAAIKLMVDIRFWDFKIQSLGPILVDNPSLNLKLIKEEKQEKTKPPPFMKWIEQYAALPVKQVKVEALNVSVDDGETVKKIQASLHISGLNQNPSDSIKLRATINDGKSEIEAHLIGKLSNYKSILDSKAVIAIESQVKINGKPAVNFDVDVKPRENETQSWVLSGKAFQEKKQFIVDLDGLRKRGAFTSKIDVTALNLSENIPKLSFDNCKATVSWGDTFGEDISGKLSCDSQAKRGRTADEKNCRHICANGDAFSF